MNRYRPGFLIVMILAMSLALAACSGDNQPSVAPSPSAGNTTTAFPSPEPSEAPEEASEEPSAVPSPPVTESPSERPETASFELMTAEGYKPHTAALKEGNGFSLYVFEGYDFEPSTGRLALTADPDYYVDIERLPTDTDLTKLKEEGEAQLSTFGEVKEYSGELVEHPLGYAELYLQATSDQDQGISDYIVWKSDEDERYLFRLRNPKTDETSTFASSVMVSLSTVG